VFVIDGIPRRLRGFFGIVEYLFEKRQWPHFQVLVLVYALAHGRRNIAHLNRFLKDQEHRQRHQDFLAESPWQGDRVVIAIALAILESMKPQEGDLLEILIDLSHAPKRGKKMEGAHRYFDPVTKSYQFGHAFLLCVLRFRGIVIPWAVKVWLPKAFCRSDRGKELGVKFKTSNQLAADVIRELPADVAARFRVRVLFDSGFLNEEVVSACRDRGFHFISVAKSNRVLFPDDYRGKRRVSSYGPGVLRTYGHNISIPGYRGKSKFRVATRTGYMRGIGKVQAVFSKRLTDGSFVTLVTDELTTTARDVVLAYKSRWPIEVTLKNLKQCLGLGQYQTRRYEGLVHHLHLCLISYQLLTTLGLEGSAEALPSDTAIEIESVAHLQDQLRILVAKDHMARLRKSKSPASVLARIKALLIAA
jgi:SRSO17 transposase